jgi:hypothetical protein
MMLYSVTLTHPSTGEVKKFDFSSREARSAFYFDVSRYKFYFTDPDRPDNKYDDSFDVSSAA